MKFYFHIKLALRSIFSQKKFSLISVLSLSLAFVSVLLIGNWVKQELSYDRHIPGHRNIYRLTLQVQTPDGYESHFARVARDWVQQVGEHIPEIESTLRFTLKRNTLIGVGEHKFSTNNLFVVDTTLFSVFELPLLEGDPGTALSDPFCVILSQSMAKKYFGDSSPVGEYISLTGQDDPEPKAHLVTGVYPDFPAASHMHPELLLSFSKPEAYGWSYFYIMLNDQTRHNELQAKLNDYVKDRVDPEEAATYSLHIQPIADIHLHSAKDREIELNGNIQSILILAGTALLILLIALFNYINLNIAQLFREVRFLVINKIYGASSAGIFFFQLLKSLIINLVTLFFTIFLARLVIFFLDSRSTSGQIFEEGISFTWWAILLGLFFLSVLAGSLPSFYFIIRRFHARTFTRSSNLVRLFQPKKKFYLRKLLIGIQLSASMILLLVVVFAGLQMRFISSKWIGMQDGEQIIVTDNLNNSVRLNYYELRNALLQSPYVLDVSALMEVPPAPIKDAMNFETDAPVKNENLMIYVGPVADNFFDFYDRPIVAGSDFPEYVQGQQFESYILNESAVRFLGWDNPADAVGKQFKLNFFAEGFFYGGKIVGVVEDFHQSSLHHGITPTVYFQQPRFYINFLIKIRQDQAKEALDFIENTWSQFIPEYPFLYKLQRQHYEEVYAKEKTQSLLSSLFTVLAIIITLIGLMGLTTILSEQRTKEMGIRTVLGAGKLNILLVTAKEILIVLAVSIFVSIPVAITIINQWLQNFTYSILPENYWWVVILVASTFFITITSLVLLIAYTSARKKPIESLKWE